MSGGLPIGRHLIVVLNNGSPVIDWGDGLGVDLYSFEFIRFSSGDYNHAAQDDELEILKKARRILSYDHNHVYLASLPELPRRFMN
jgi:hypothetical protein